MNRRELLEEWKKQAIFNNRNRKEKSVPMQKKQVPVLQKPVPISTPKIKRLGVEATPLKSKIPTPIKPAKTFKTQYTQTTEQPIAIKDKLHYFTSRPRTMALVTRLPRVAIDLFEPSDALTAAKNGQQQLARALFKIILLAKYSKRRRVLLKENVKSTQDYSQDPSLWTAWAWFEEQWNCFEDAFQVFEMAQFNLQNGLELVQAELRLFLQRLQSKCHSPTTTVEPCSTVVENAWRSRSPSPVEIDSDSDDFERELEIREITRRIQEKENSDSVDATPKPITRSKPFVSANDLAKQMSSLDLKSPLQQRSNNVVVPFGKEDGSSRSTFLTPVKASKLVQKELGVSKVLTPVRRSTRLYEKQGNENLQELLETFDYAFVPNKSVPVSLKRRP